MIRQTSEINVTVALELNAEELMNAIKTSLCRNKFILLTPNTYSSIKRILENENVEHTPNKIFGHIIEQAVFKRNSNCIICCDEQSNVVLKPCRHLVMCNICFQKYIDLYAVCPICKDFIADSEVVYPS